MAAPAELTAVTAAVAAVDTAPTDPAAAVRLVADARRLGPGDPQVAVLTERALGLAALARGDAAEAVSRLGAAVRWAERAGLSERAGEARMSLAFALFNRGQTRAALEALEAAAPALHGTAAARLQAQRALVLTRLGRLDEALAGYSVALRRLRRGGDRRWQLRALLNRGVLHAYRGAWRAAEADLAAGERLATELGDDAAADSARENLGFVAALQGDVPGALARYDAAEAACRARGSYTGRLLLDRAEVLLSVRLVAEARATATAAVTEQTRRRMAADLAEGRLVLAEACLLAGDAATAGAAAAAARRAFHRQQRPAWAALAAWAELRAAAQRGMPAAGRLRRSRAVAEALDAAGWTAQALDARLLGGLTMVAAGSGQLPATAARAGARTDLAAARADLATAALAARRSHLAAVRARGWHATALLREAAGDRRGAQGALRAGLRAVDTLTATLGATELRAHAAGHGADLAAMGLRLALADGRAAAVLEWTERWRAGALRLPPARPPDDDALSADLGRLRAAAAEADAAVAAGADPLPARRRQAALERTVAARARHARGTGVALSPAAVGDLRARLGDRALLSYVAAGQRLLAVTLCGGRARLHDLGSLPAMAREVEALGFALRRVARPRGPARLLGAAQEALALAADRLDVALVAPLRPTVGDRPVVVVPTGAFHALAWGLLPSLADRPVSVAPSAGLWLRAAAAGPRRGIVLVAGPDLPHAPAEVAALARRYPRATRLTGAKASTAAVLAALDGAATAHVAAHGRFRADNPLFSSLRLDDGPLTVHDLGRLRRVPTRLVLSACDAGLSSVHPGDELMGLAAALLSLGAATLVAAVAPVDDAATRRLMLRFHAHLCGGAGPAAALAAARAEVSGGTPAEQATAGAFLCLGAG